MSASLVRPYAWLKPFQETVQKVLVAYKSSIQTLLHPGNGSARPLAGKFARTWHVARGGADWQKRRCVLQSKQALKDCCSKKASLDTLRTTWRSLERVKQK